MITNTTQVCNVDRSPLFDGIPAAGPRRSFYQPELDSLRFFAFFSVFLFHSMYHPANYFSERGVPAWLAQIVTGVIGSGSHGVDLFFVLSSYLITELLLREKEENGRLHVNAFYIRRILRIWPLYYFFVAAAALIPFLNPQGAFSLKYVIPFLLLSGNWSTIVFGLTGSVAEPLWSVSVEEQFYLLWPPVVARLSRRGLVIAVAVMIVTANVARFILLARHDTGWQIWANSFAHLDAMAGGIFLAILMHGRFRKIGLLSRTILIAAGTTSIAVTGYFDALHTNVSSRVVLVGYPLVALACTLIVSAVVGSNLRVPKLQYLGKISYGLYVYHLASIRFSDWLLHFQWGVAGILLRSCVALILTILLGSISYHFLESPFLNLKKKFTFVESRPV